LVWIPVRWKARPTDDQPRLLVVAQVHPRVGLGLRFSGSFCSVTASIGTPGAPVLLHEAHEVLRVGRVGPRVVLEAPPGERVVGLRPRGLDGVAMIFRLAFRRSAWRRSGRISARSWAIEKCFNRKSVCPGPTSS
jgi:hypothetical protein